MDDIKMNKHTPGPWFRDGKTVYALNPRNFNRFCAQVQDAHTPDDELIANAVLMEAALELLVALEEARKQVVELCLYNKIPMPDASLSRYDAAIAKARGES